METKISFTKNVYTRLRGFCFFRQAVYRDGQRWNCVYPINSNIYKLCRAHNTRNVSTFSLIISKVCLNLALLFYGSIATDTHTHTLREALVCPGLKCELISLIAPRCCNTCDDVREAYRRRGWAFKNADTIEQCKREGFTQKMQEQKNEGCQVYGFLEVNKVQTLSCGQLEFRE